MLAQVFSGLNSSFQVKVCVVVGYSSNEEGDRFWNDVDRILNREGKGYRLCILGDLNGWLGDS